MSRRGHALASLATLSLLTAAAPAASYAAAPWSEPVTVPGGGSSSALALSPTGRGLVTTLGPGAYGRRFPGTSVAGLGPDGSIGSFRVLARNFDAGGYPGRVTVDAAGRVSAVGAEGTRSGSRLVAVGGALGRPFSRRRDIGLGEPIASSAVGSNARGDQAVVFQVSGSSRSFRRRAVYLVRRRTGRAFGRPVRVARGPGVAELDVAVGDTGRVAVAWARGRRVATRVTTHGRLGRVATVGDAGTDTSISAAVARSGAVLVSWAAEDLGAGTREGGDDYGPYVVRAVLDTTGGRFQRELGPSDQPTVAAEPAGVDRFVLAHEGDESGRSVVRVSEVGAPGIGAAQTVSAPGGHAALADLATGPRGEAVVVWLTGDEGGRFDRAAGIAAAVRAPGAPAFSTPEEVARPVASPGIDLAIDPAGGRVLLTLDSLESPLRLIARPPVSP